MSKKYNPGDVYLKGRVPTPAPDETDELIQKMYEADYPDGTKAGDFPEMKKELLALHLGCLPEKMAVPINVRSFNNGMSGITTNPYKEGEIKGHNSAVDLMEQKLREAYGE